MNILVEYLFGIVIAIHNHCQCLLVESMEVNMRKLMMVILMAVGCAFAGTATKVDTVKAHKDTAKIFVKDSIKPVVFKAIPDSLKHKIDSAWAVKKAEKPSKIAVDSLRKASKVKRDSLVGLIKDVKVKGAVKARIDSVEVRHYRLRDKIEEKKELIKAKKEK